MRAKFGQATSGSALPFNTREASLSQPQAGFSELPAVGIAAPGGVLRHRARTTEADRPGYCRTLLGIAGGDEWVVRPEPKTFAVAVLIETVRS